MPVSTSTVATEHASKYLQQLCKHWSHKFTVEFTAKSGRVPFSDTAEVTFSADHAALYMRLSAADPAQRAIRECRCRPPEAICFPRRTPHHLECLNSTWKSHDKEQ